MEVRIGVNRSNKEIEIELDSDVDLAKISKQIESSLGTDSTILWLTDRRGRKVGVPSSSIAYIEIDPSGDERRVGFGAVVK